MPTDLQASSSSTSSICKQSSLDDSYGLENSKTESNLSKELMQTHLNGTISSFCCCTPIGLKCNFDEEGKNRIHSDFCKVICTNYNCDQSGWIHSACLKLWEQKIKSDIMKVNPQIRACLERQRTFNPWMDIFQNLLPKSYLCPCNQGMLRRFDSNLGSGTINAEASYFAGQSNSNRRKLVPNAHLPVSQSGPNFPPNGGGGHRKNSLDNNSLNSYMNFTKRFRSRTLSANQMMMNYTVDGHVISPTDLSAQKKDIVASTSIKSTNTQPTAKMTNGSIGHKTKSQNRQRHHSATYHGSNFASKEELASSNQPAYNLAGNIFRQRSDFKNFQRLPFSKQNAYFIQMEDDSCTGNDDTKVFLLSHLSQLGLNTVSCLICTSQLAVYDHLPLIDGTFFLSPLCHSPSSIPISASSNPPGTSASNANNSSSAASNTHSQSSQAGEKYLNVVCTNCMHEIIICCQFCHRPWTGAQLLIGSLYTYDIFAAVPCCTNRLLCNNCNRLCIDITSGSNESSSSSNKTVSSSLSAILSNFSQLSKMIECTNCHNRDYHFVKPFGEIFKPIGSYA